MRWTLWILPLSLSVLLASCSLIDSAKSAVEDLKKVADKTVVHSEKVEKGLKTIEDGLALIGDKGTPYVAAIKELRDDIKAADLNKDSKISGISEWKELLIALVLFVQALFTKKGLDRVDEKRKLSLSRVHERIDSIGDNTSAPTS